VKVKTLKLKIANGALLEVPVFREHYRASNWLAVIDVDGTSPGGLSRRFIDRGKGECFYLVEQVALFSAVEFGADYTTSVGKRHPERYYGVVTAKTDDYMIVEGATSGASAVIRAKEARISLDDRKKALHEELETLKNRAAAIETAISDIEITGADQNPFENHQTEHEKAQ
jgi:hypothetical protein